MIGRMVDIVMIRTFEQSKLERFAAHSRVPVINGLTNEYHPARSSPTSSPSSSTAARGAEGGHTRLPQGKVVAWVGDGNNMANTWAQAADILGFTLHREHARRLRDRSGARRRGQPGVPEALQPSARGLPRRRTW